MAHTLPAMERVAGRLETDYQYFFKDVPKTAKISNTLKTLEGNEKYRMIYRKLKDPVVRIEIFLESLRSVFDHVPDSFTFTFSMISCLN